MRTPTRLFLARLQARKRTTVLVLFAVMCGGMLASGSALA